MTPRFTIGLIWSLGVAAAALPLPDFDDHVRAAPGADLAAVCARLGNDDTIRDYDPSLRARTASAFRKLFPNAKDVPGEESWPTQAQYRCMNGKVMVCFVGANLPCAKMNAQRDNPGADTFCRDNPDAGGVPAYATGHDTTHAYRCRNGKAEATGTTRQLDQRGFARELWIALPAQ
ncbi:hypothetical protein [Bosea sp. (in: a-proteobacteria)]|jgi:hypothetical protein|uniref:hypothetical protein n=1 Tax=Bosea sp. (in: a-proteobacteria) TaxID=1871050 RepID=UPI002DDD038A|nr:hypothetical protein [Bosea sp. (in: a-proteobacteria)]HEV2512916.1 hypothetical protein [Bosea sp. (in: a-proteobacteria)]